MLRYVELILSEDEPTGVTGVAIVDQPAVQRNFVLFGRQSDVVIPQRFSWDEGSQTLYGVLMLANVPILRYDTDNEPYYVFFRPETIRKMMVRASKLGALNNVNLMHDPGKPVDGVYYIGGYQVDTAKGLTPHFATGKITDGSWIGIYHIDNSDVKNLIKEGKFRGFSIEGEFVHKDVPLYVK
jgi:hypothetical protein